MAKLSPKMTELLKELETVRQEYDNILEDCSIKSFPGAFDRANDQLSDIIQKIEDGEFEEEAENEGDSKE